MDRGLRGRAVGRTRYERCRASASCHDGISMPAARSRCVRQRAVARARRTHRHVGHARGLERRPNAENPRDFLGESVPGRVAGVHHVIGAVRRPRLDQLPRRLDDVVHETGADDPIDEDPGRLPCTQRGDDPVDAAVRGRAAEEALDAQHVVRGGAGRHPFADELRLPIDVRRRRGVGFRVRGTGRAVEYEVRAVVHEHRAGARGRTRQRLDGPRIDGERGHRIVFGRVDRVVGRGVQDDLRTLAGNSIDHRGMVGHVEIAARQRDEVGAIREAGRGGRAQLPGSADDQDTRLHAATERRICWSSNSPSQRATTTEARQLPSTFTPVRAMSST